MNRTNVGANTNTVQILLDIFILLFALGINILLFGTKLGSDELSGFIILAGVFILIYMLSNKEAYLYNVTLFYYLDRVHRKITKSFLIAMVATGVLVNYVMESEQGKRFYLTFLIVSYIYHPYQAMRIMQRYVLAYCIN